MFLRSVERSEGCSFFKYMLQNFKRCNSSGPNLNWEESYSASVARSMGSVHTWSAYVQKRGLKDNSKLKDILADSHPTIRSHDTGPRVSQLIREQGSTSHEFRVVPTNGTCSNHSAQQAARTTGRSFMMWGWLEGWFQSPGWPHEFRVVSTTWWGVTTRVE